jgi:anti-sigma-K factor RskA
MNCEELQEMFELYSLGVLEHEETEELEAHLERGCTTCQENLRHALSVNAALIGSCPDLAPSPKLKRRIMASIGVQPRGWGWLGAFATACLLVIALWLGNEERQRGAELAQARQSIIEVSLQRDRLNNSLRILDQPETVRVAFGKGLPEPPRGNVFINAKLGVMLVASNLPRLSTGKTYEMWLIPKGGAPRPAGLFQSTDAGSAVHVLSGPVDTAALGAVAVTVEPEAGSLAPTTQPLITAIAGI